MKQQKRLEESGKMCFGFVDFIYYFFVTVEKPTIATLRIHIGQIIGCNVILEIVNI